MEKETNKKTRARISIHTSVEGRSLNESSKPAQRQDGMALEPLVTDMELVFTGPSLTEQELAQAMPRMPLNVEPPNMDSANVTLAPGTPKKKDELSPADLRRKQHSGYKAALKFLKGLEDRSSESLTRSDDSAKASDSKRLRPEGILASLSSKPELVIIDWNDPERKIIVENWLKLEEKINQALHDAKCRSVNPFLAEFDGVKWFKTDQRRKKAHERGSIPATLLCSFLTVSQIGVSCSKQRSMLSGRNKGFVRDYSQEQAHLEHGRSTEPMSATLRGRQDTRECLVTRWLMRGLEPDQRCRLVAR
ncbi:hypothetical protein ACLKA6_000249 [Drosophila palustris]